MNMRARHCLAIVISAVLLFMGAPALPQTAQADEVSSRAEVAGPYVAASSLSLLVQAADYDVSWFEGKTSPFTIDNVKQLKGLSYLVNSGIHDFKGETVQLTSDVTRLFVFRGDLSLEPIGTPSHPFRGMFDGSGKSIVNLTLDAKGSLSYVGMFGNVEGADSAIKNLQLKGGKVEVTNKKAGKTISHVGAIAGNLEGSLENCYSTVAVSVTNNGAAPDVTGKTPEELCTITYIGGLVGSLGGDMARCTHADSAVSVASTSDVTEGVPYIAGYVGGLVGCQGFENDARHITNTSRCTNAGPVTLAISGSGGVDRFGAQTYSKSTMVGGIVGYAMGDIVDCINKAEVQTGVLENGAVQAGWGASTCGGIVGSLRGPTIAESTSATGVVGSNDTDPGYSEWQKTSGGIEQEQALADAIGLEISCCSNTANITGLASVAGIAGSTGAFTQVIGCSNTGEIEGTRWNKPCPSGIVGISNGDIAYCYNQGRVVSTTGGGYYASGITALLTTYNVSATPDAMRLSIPELYGCYITGMVGGNNQQTGMRSAVIAGENDGFIHDNCFLPDLSVDKAKDKDGFNDGKNHSRLVSDGEDRGTLARNYELSVAEMKSGLSVSYLNKPHATKNDWSLYYTAVPSEYPQLSWQYKAPSTKQLSNVASGVATVENPAYSAAYAPIPSVQLSSSTTLYQNADYRVVVDEGARIVGNTYSASIEGINAYSGTLSARANYTIGKADIGSCTVSAPPAQFNWEQQQPKEVTVRDDAGNVVDPSEYTFRTLANSDGDAKAVKGRYYDYINAHGAGYRYDIEVRANDDSAHFTGTTTQAAFQITWASLMYSPEDEQKDNRAPTAKLGNVVMRDDSGAIVEEWDIGKALKTKGFVKVKYTGKEVKPEFASVSYLGREMRNGTGKQYYYYPLDYDYLYVYGNPNPEDGKDISASCINATGSDERSLACVTVRFTTGGNFDNYTNVFYEITPASIADDVKVSGMAKTVPCRFGGATVSPKLTYNGMTLKQGADYTLTYKNNKKAGTATVTITGKGNYAGSVKKTFKVVKGTQPLTVKAHAKSVKQSKVAKANVSVKAFKLSGAQGAVTCKNVSSNKIARTFKVNKSGNVVVPKGTKKGVYEVVLKATAKGNANYKPGTVQATAKVTVK